MSVVELPFQTRDPINSLKKNSRGIPNPIKQRVNPANGQPCPCGGLCALENAGINGQRPLTRPIARHRVTLLQWYRTFVWTVVYWW